MLYYYDDKLLGRIVVQTRRGSRTISARWHDDQLQINVPLGTPVPHLQQFIDEHRERIMKMKAPSLSYTQGQVIQCFGCTVTLGVQSVKPRHITIKHEGDNITLGLPADTNFNSAYAKKNISSILQLVMAQEAPKRLFPYAEQLARKLGAQVKAFELGRGRTKLGHCTPQRVIQLSRNVMFLTPELVDLIICHELAHLQHMNHSAEFHALCNTYLNGRERELDKKLKQFVWPIIR